LEKSSFEDVNWTSVSHRNKDNYILIGRGWT